LTAKLTAGYKAKTEVKKNWQVLLKKTKIRPLKKLYFVSRGGLFVYLNMILLILFKN